MPVKLARTGLVILLYGSCLLRGAAARASEDDFDRALLKEAPKVLAYLKQKGCQNVGVLKFRVKKGDEPITDRAGTLNLTAAERLERALILADDVRNPVGIVRQASAVAAGTRGVNHLTEQGRRKLFEARYPLAWGNQQVQPDAFLTGVIQVSPDLRSLTVGILAVGKDGGPLETVAKFTVAMDVDSLLETGESFLLRGAFDEGKVVEQKPPASKLAAAKVAETAVRVKHAEEQYPLAATASPVELEIRYDEKPVRLEIRGGRAQVPEPKEGQQVSFVLTRKDSGKERYGVVLKVNGENTLYRQRLRDVQCTKWVFDPGDPPTVIGVYQTTTETGDPFRVLSRAASKQREMDYGTDVGTITMTVFREYRGRDEPAVALTDEAEDLAALTRGDLPREPPKNLAALKEQLRDSGKRGLIDGQGEQISSKVRRVPFRPDPVPVMSATITYYRP